MSMIRTFNQAVGNAVNTEGTFYQTLIGQDPFTPEATIDESSDFNCGALCNELEFCRSVSDYYVQSFDTDLAESGNLDLLIQGFVDLPRRHEGESDSIYRKRFRFLIVEKVNERRTTKWAILDAISYFIADMDKVQFVEPFDTYNNYFEIRIEGVVSYDDAIFLNNTEQAYVGQDFIGGAGVGVVISYLGNLIDRIKAAGVDYDLFFILQDRFTKTADAIIGVVQMYKTADAVVKAAVSFTKTADTTVIALSQPAAFSVPVTLHEPTIADNVVFVKSAMSAVVTILDSEQQAVVPIGAAVGYEVTVYDPSITVTVKSEALGITATMHAPTVSKV